MAHRWLRTKFECKKEMQNVVGPVYFVFALRSDGQMFEAHVVSDGTNVAAIERDLRAKVMSFINDPAMPPTVDEDGNTWSNQHPLDAYKGQPGWAEEPEPC